MLYLNTEYGNLLEHAIEVTSPLYDINVAITTPPGVIVERRLEDYHPLTA